MTDDLARLAQDDEARERDLEDQRRGAGASDACSPAEVGFCDDGVVIPTKVSPVIESLRDTSSIVGEALRLLGARMMDLRRQRETRCLGLTSALPGDGKSTISVGLAAALAREPGRRILLVEADMRQPSLTPTLGLPPAPGLSEWLGRDLDFVPVRVVQPGGFYLLVAGQSGLDRPEVLGSRRMEALLRAARGLFDFVLLDVAPVLPVADTVLVQDLVDGFLIVVRSRLTPRDAVQDALARLQPHRVLGIVLNDHREYRDSYSSYAYHRYGMADRARFSRGPKEREPADPGPPVSATGDSSDP
jgi:receptor protein-tyrosine kinase